MRGYVLRRLLVACFLIVGVMFAVFAIMETQPGDPVVIMLSGPHSLEPVRECPFLVRFGRFACDALHGNLGLSIRGQTPVTGEILQRFPYSAKLGVTSLLFSTVLGVPLGMLAALRRQRNDRWLRTLSLATRSIPNYWLGIVLVLLFCVPPERGMKLAPNTFRDLVLPALCLGLAPAAELMETTRTCALGAMGKMHVLAARARGLTTRVVLARHVLRNVAGPVLTELGRQTGAILGSLVFVESVFAKPGIGRFLINAISAKDYPQVQGGVLFVSALCVLVVLLMELLRASVDPRVMLQAGTTKRAPIDPLSPLARSVYLPGGW